MLYTLGERKGLTPASLVSSYILAPFIVSISYYLLSIEKNSPINMISAQIITALLLFSMVFLLSRIRIDKEITFERRLEFKPALKLLFWGIVLLVVFDGLLIRFPLGCAGATSLTAFNKCKTGEMLFGAKGFGELWFMVNVGTMALIATCLSSFHLARRLFKG